VLPADHDDADHASKKVRVGPEHRDGVIEYLKTHEFITAGIAQELFNISRDQSTDLLNDMVDSGILEKDGVGKGTKYRIKRVSAA